MLDVGRLREAGSDDAKVILWRQNAMLRVQLLCTMHKIQQSKKEMTKLMVERQKDKQEIEKLRAENLVLKNFTLKNENNNLNEIVCQFQQAFRDKDRLRKVIQSILADGNEKSESRSRSQSGNTSHRTA